MNNSKSSNGQDKWVIEQYNNISNGYFIEIGAFDGVHSSNTYLLEQSYNWRGVCIEPSVNFILLRQNRKCHTVNALVSDKTMPTAKFIDCKKNGSTARYSLRSGIYDDIIKPGRAVTKGYNAQKYETRRTKTLTHILDKLKAPRLIQYLSLDTEGSELFILRSINFKKYIIPIITIEPGWATYGKSVKLLSKLGYKLAHKFPGDDAYILPQYFKKNKT